MEYLANQTSFRLKSGKTVSLSDMEGIEDIMKAREVQMACVEALADQGVMVSRIPAEELAGYMEEFEYDYVRDNFYEDSYNQEIDGSLRNLRMASRLDAMHHCQAEELLQDTCGAYIREHRQEIMKRLEPSDGKKIFVDAREEAEVLVRQWRKQLAAARMLQEKRGGCPVPEEVLRLAEGIYVYGDSGEPSVNYSTQKQFPDLFPHEDYEVNILDLPFQ